MKKIEYILAMTCCIVMAACSKSVKVEEKIDSMPPIFPDYTEVTMPVNIAAPCFSIPDSINTSDARAIFASGNEEVTVDANKGQISISQSDWNDLAKASQSIKVRVQACLGGKWVEYSPFNIYIANDRIDPYIAYRLIEPGYETWNEMGIYQRNLESYEQTAIITNKMTKYGCMNCHSFCKQNPEKMLFHLRAECAGTYIVDKGNIKKLNTKTPQTISPLVYPSWHPSGNYVAFSVNSTKQMFHTMDKNRIEVLDYASDVVVYDVKKDEVVTSSLLYSNTAFETFPTFSPDGKKLYFCSADTVAIPAKYDEVRYSLCSISFDEKNRSFGDVVDTLYNARKEGKSVSFPRVSPDGKYLMFTLASYGNFSIWHRDADLYMVDLKSGKIDALTALNSNETESYHSWSSNSRWVVFSSRRIDGLYTRPFIGYIDKNGKSHKPFLLPQKDKDYYTLLMKSYNIPEFISGRVNLNPGDMRTIAKDGKGVDISFAN